MFGEGTFEMDMVCPALSAADHRVLCFDWILLCAVALWLFAAWKLVQSCTAFKP